MEVMNESAAAEDDGSSFRLCYRLQGGEDGRGRSRDDAIQAG